MLCLEIVFILIKANKRMKGINIFQPTYLYSAYADNATFFLRYKRSIKEFLNTFAAFSKYSGLKKIIRPQCSWVRRLYDDSFHEWKVISLKLIKKSFGSHFKFHLNLLFNISCINDFPTFYLDVTGKIISQPIQKLHCTFCLNICGLIKL